MFRTLAVLGLLGLSIPACAQNFTFVYDGAERIWSLSNGLVTAQFEWNAASQFHLLSFSLANQPNTWLADAPRLSSPIRFTFDGTTYDATTPWRLASQSLNCPDQNSCTQIVELVDLAGAVQAHVELSMYAGQPVLRHSVTVTNLKSTGAFMTDSDMLPYVFNDSLTSSYRMFRVNQWSVGPSASDFETSQFALQQNGTPVNLLTGAHGVQCSWFAIRDGYNRGIFAGWEFDGLTNASVRRGANATEVQLSARVSDLNHQVGSQKVFRIPPAFIGLFVGDWDEAGYRTQRFVEAALAKPLPDNKNFPYLVWDSWAYQADINEQILRLEAKKAAELGVEVFIVDLGWATRIGDWVADPVKFPNGLRPLSDYVHSMGMKFGLHFAFAEADPDSAVMQDHPEWVATESDNYFGGLSLCLANQPARDWIVAQAVRMIDDYAVDWILQDGENMVKRCTQTNHTHDPADSNYANAVFGVNQVISTIQGQRPNVMWENCENGGNMMTFNMVKYYVTSITNDASGAFPSRQAVYGATYPFPPRYTDRYQPEDFTSTYITRSYMFGGPWHLMNKLATMTADQWKLAQSETGVYKQIRTAIRDGKVFHLAPPANATADALQSYDPVSDSSIAIVCRGSGDGSPSIVTLRGLDPLITYQVTFQSDPRALMMTGQQLMDTGVSLNLAAGGDGEIVYVKPAGALNNASGHP